MQASSFSAFLAELFTTENVLFFAALFAATYVLLQVIKRISAKGKAAERGVNPVIQAATISAVIAVVAQIAGFTPSQLNRTEEGQAPQTAENTASEATEQVAQNQEGNTAAEASAITFSDIKEVADAREDTAAEAPADAKAEVERILAEAKAQGKAADLSNQDLRNADLSQVELKDARLEATDLRGAWLAGADLSGADLKDARLEGAVIVGAKLDKAQNLKAKQLEGAIINKEELAAADGRKFAPTQVPAEIAAEADLVEISGASADVQSRFTQSKQASATSAEEDATTAQ